MASVCDKMMAVINPNLSKKLVTQPNIVVFINIVWSKDRTVDVRKPNVRFAKSNKKAFDYRTFGSLTLNRTFGSTKLGHFIFKKNL